MIDQTDAVKIQFESLGTNGFIPPNPNADFGIRIEVGINADDRLSAYQRDPGRECARLSAPLLSFGPSDKEDA